MDKLTLPLGLGKSRDFDLQAQNVDGTIPTIFLATDTLACTVAIGRGQPPLITLAPPSIQWLDAPTAQFRVSFSNADTAGKLNPGRYYIQADAIRGARSDQILDAWLQILPVPGTDPPVPTYTTYPDLQDYAPWIGDLQAAESATGFVRQQGMARAWLDQIIISRYSVGDTAPIIGSPGFANWSMFIGTVDFAPSKWLRDQLALNTLIVQPLTREIVACQALFYITQPQIGSIGDTPFVKISQHFSRRASSLVKTYRTEIDLLPQDGWADIIVRCGSTNLR